MHITCVDDSGAVLVVYELAPHDTLRTLMQQLALHFRRPYAQIQFRIVPFSSTLPPSANDVAPRVYSAQDAVTASRTLSDVAQEANMTNGLYIRLDAHVTPGASATAAAAAQIRELFARGTALTSASGASHSISSVARGAAEAAAAANRASHAVDAVEGTTRPMQTQPRHATATSPRNASSAERAPLPDLPLDVDSAEVQRRLYEEIQRSNIEENLVHALEYTPEVFTSITMLYVPCVVNALPVKAFVDSGAQVSILNVCTAERCGLMRLLDKRVGGIARGVGTQRILGRIHLAMVNLAGLHLPFSFCVLEGQEMDMIIGLDQMRRHQMRLDLGENCLCIGDTSVPFLPEGELPDYAKPGYARSWEEEENECENGIQGSSRHTSHYHENANKDTDAVVTRVGQDDRGKTTPHGANHLKEDNRDGSAHHVAHESKDDRPDSSALASLTTTGGAANRENTTTISIGTSSINTSTPHVNAPGVVSDDTRLLECAEARKADAMRELALATFMDMTQMENHEEARQLLEGANWDVDVAATLFFGEE